MENRNKIEADRLDNDIESVLYGGNYHTFEWLVEEIGLHNAIDEFAYGPLTDPDGGGASNSRKRQSGSLNRRRGKKQKGTGIAFGGARNPVESAVLQAGGLFPADTGGGSGADMDLDSDDSFSDHLCVVLFSNLTLFKRA